MGGGGGVGVFVPVRVRGGAGGGVAGGRNIRVLAGFVPNILMEGAVFGWG